MSRQKIWEKGHHMLVQNGNRNSLYWTVVNTKDKSHTHISCHGKGNLKQALLIIHRANVGNIKPNFPYFIKLSIFRVLDVKNQDLYMDLIKENDVTKYYKGNLDDVVFRTKRGDINGSRRTTRQSRVQST